MKPKQTPQLSESDMRRFWRKVIIPKSDWQCWEWSGSHCENGYSKITAQNRSLSAHRISWEMANQKKIPEGLYIDHMCQNRGCVNPSHLQAVTPLENMYVSTTKTWGVQTHCKHGHPFESGWTIKLKHGGIQRMCPACQERRKIAARHPQTKFKVNADVAIRIRKERELTGDTHRKLAKKFNLGRQTIATVLSGKSNYPSTVEYVGRWKEHNQPR